MLLILRELMNIHLRSACPMNSLYSPFNATVLTMVNGLVLREMSIVINLSYSIYWSKMTAAMPTCTHTHTYIYIYIYSVVNDGVSRRHAQHTVTTSASKYRTNARLPPWLFTCISYRYIKSTQQQPGLNLIFLRSMT